MLSQALNGLRIFVLIHNLYWTCTDILLIIPWTIHHNSYLHNICIILGIISNVEIQYIGRCICVTCDYGIILCKRLEHPWNWYPWGPESNPLQTLKNNCDVSITYTEMQYVCAYTHISLHVQYMCIYAGPSCCTHSQTKLNLYNKLREIFSSSII